MKNPTEKFRKVCGQFIFTVPVAFDVFVFFFFINSLNNVSWNAFWPLT